MIISRDSQGAIEVIVLCKRFLQHLKLFIFFLLFSTSILQRGIFLRDYKPSKEESVNL